MHDRLSRWVARLLAHPAGFAVFNIFTAAWFALPFAIGGAAAAVFGWKVGLGALLLSRWLLPGYLDVVTWFSSATQFTLAYQNEKAGRKLDEALETIDRVVDEVYVTSQALLQLARNETNIQQALVTQSAAIHAAIAELRHHLTKENP